MANAIVRKVSAARTAANLVRLILLLLKRSINNIVCSSLAKGWGHEVLAYLLNIVGARITGRRSLFM
jgi:hypothetical protein